MRHRTGGESRQGLVSNDALTTRLDARSTAVSGRRRPVQRSGAGYRVALLLAVDQSPPHQPPPGETGEASPGLGPPDQRQHTARPARRPQCQGADTRIHGGLLGDTADLVFANGKLARGDDLPEVQTIAQIHPAHGGEGAAHDNPWRSITPRLR